MSVKLGWQVMCWKVLMAVATLVGMPMQASSTEYPSHPVTILVAFPPGGVLDIYMRGLAPLIEKSLGQPVLVENRPGALGTLAASTVARAKPDGYTLFQVSQNIFRAPHLNDKVPYRIGEDFRFIVGLADTDHVLAVRADSPYETLESFLQAARAEPKTLTYGSTGIGGTVHLCIVELSEKAGVELLHVPFKGAPEQIHNLIGGDIDAMGVPYSQATNLGDKIRILAIFAKQRTEASPSVPTASEFGYEVAVTSHVGIAGPAGMSEAVAEKLESAIYQATQSLEYDALLRNVGMVESYMPSQNYRQWVEEMIVFEENLIKSAGISLHSSK